MNYVRDPTKAVLGNVEEILLCHPKMRVLSLSSHHYKVLLNSFLGQLWMREMAPYLEKYAIQFMVFGDNVVVLKPSLDHDLIRLIDFLDDNYEFEIRVRFESECSENGDYKQYRLGFEQ